jgi:hypothetical protein
MGPDVAGEGLSVTLVTKKYAAAELKCATLKRGLIGQGGEYNALRCRQISGRPPSTCFL